MTVERSDVAARRRHDRVTWGLGYGACLLLTAVVGLLARATSPHPFPLALLVLLLMCGVMIFRPVTGICLVAFFTVIGDIVTTSWYPFTKNLSSKESILFVSKQLNLSPLELCLLMLATGWVLGMAGSRNWHVVRGRLFWPVLAFTAFVVFGLGYGLAKGGDSKIALSEARSMFYLAVLYVITTNVFKERRQYVRLYGFLLTGIVIHVGLSFFYIRGLSAATRENPESLMQHSSALLMNVLVVMLVAMLLMHGGSPAKRRALMLACIPTLVVYLEVKRRAAIVGLLAAGVVMFAVLFWTNRRKFMWLAPLTLIVGTAYVGAFWNAQGGAGFPAQAVKSVIAPNQLSERDQASNFYRIIETVDVQYTIRASKYLGLGFGHPFYKPVALPAITTFALADYVPHNSMLYMWIKLGAGGFVCMLYLFGTAMRTGARAALRIPRGEYAAITLVSVSFVLMYAVYTYVDIAWDQKSMVFLALAMAQLDSVAWLPDPDAVVAVPASEPVALVDEAPVGALV